MTTAFSLPAQLTSFRAFAERHPGDQPSEWPKDADEWALKRQGTPAEMLIFPGENHELTRAGRPRHRVERFAAVLDWWARHLPVTR